MEYTLKLSQQDVQVIIAALGELPLKISGNAFGIVRQQIAEQDAAGAIPLSSLQEGKAA
jgi:hypothetical protein